MKQEFNINLSKVLFDLLAINIALGITNLVIFYTFWVDGWSYPSLFIYINLCTLLVFFLSGQFLLNPSFSLKTVSLFSLRYLFVIFSFITIYWLIILDRKYYLVHLILFFSLTILFIILFRILWIKIFNTLLRRIYSTKNVMIVSRDNQKMIQTILHHDWLKYSIEHGINDLNPSDIQLYTKQFDLDIMIIDLKGKDKELIAKYREESANQNLKVFFLNPGKAKKTVIKKIIDQYKLYS